VREARGSTVKPLQHRQPTTKVCETAADTIPQTHPASQALQTAKMQHADSH